MKKIKILIFTVLFAITGVVNAATQEEIQQAIDDGLAWLASSQDASGSWSYAYEGTLAATGSAALAFIEAGYLPGNDVIINSTNYGDVVGAACSYIFDRAQIVDIGAQTMGHPEDYDNNGSGDGNGKGIYFDPAFYKRDVYTTGIISSTVYALGEALGEDTLVNTGTAEVSAMTYKEVMRDVVDWFSYGQNDPEDGVHRGGWRYTDNYHSSDNSTAQWGALPMLYADSWDLAVPNFVESELELWTDYIQNSANGDWKDGGSGYSWPEEYVNIAKTGGMLLQFAVEGKPLSDPDVQAALNYMDSMNTFDHWNQAPTWWPDQWDGGNFGNPYAMWAVYKGLATYGGLVWNDNGTPGDPSDDFLVGNPSLISTALGGITIGYEGDEQLSLAGDWYSQYCDYLVGLQNSDGSWSGYDYWYGALATGWYINILNATGTPPEQPVVPVPGAILLGGIGLAVSCWKLRRSKEL